MKKRTKLIAGYLLLVVIVAFIAYSLAAYTSLSSAKRVVTVRGSEQYFTSDILVQYEPGQSLSNRVKSFGKNETSRTFSVKVSNHLQNDETKYDKKNINYTLNVELVNANETTVTDASLQDKLKVNEQSLTNGKYTTDASLAGGKATDITYKFDLTGDEILQYRIKITAVPKNRAETECKPLGRLILLAVDSTSSNWTGSFLTTEKNAVQSGKTLDFLNYRISGHVKEDCILSWQSDRVEIDQWFLEQVNHSEISTEGNKKSVTLHLGAAGTPQQYTIQFYRTYAADDLKEDWSTIQSYVTFKNSKGE